MLRLQAQNFHDRPKYIYPTNWLKTTTKMCLFHLLLPMTPLLCNPLSTQSPLRKVGQSPPTANQRRGAWRGGVSRPRSRKITLSAAEIRPLFHSFFQYHLTEDLLIMADQREKSTDQMKLWKESRGYQVCISVFELCAALSLLEYLGEGSCKVQNRTFSPILIPKENIYTNSSWSQTLLPVCYISDNVVMSVFWSLASLLSLHGIGKKQTVVLFTYLIFPYLNVQRFQYLYRFQY